MIIVMLISGRTIVDERDSLYDSLHFAALADWFHMLNIL